LTGRSRESPGTVLGYRVMAPTSPGKERKIRASMAASLPILDVAVTGIGRAVQSLPRLLAIYWLPWLLGTVVLVILEVVVQDQLRLGWAPDWAREIVWAPFVATAYLMLLRWMLDGEPPARAINFEVGRKTWVATPIVAAWFVANITVSDAPMAMMRWLSRTFSPTDGKMPRLTFTLLASPPGS